jgi:hypothetical protein
MVDANLSLVSVAAITADSTSVITEQVEAEAEDGIDADADPEGVISARLRKLQQGADVNAGYAKAARLIFTNIFDYFRANGELELFSQQFNMNFIAK